MNRFLNASLALVVALAMTAGPFCPASKAIAAEERDRLTASELFEPGAFGTGPIDNRYFLPIGNAGPALHPLSATLVIPETAIPEAENSRYTFGEFPGVKAQSC